MTVLIIVAAVWLVMSIYTYTVYAYDKKIAGSGARRVPEKKLLTLAFLMGAPGAYAAMQILRHKTKHKQFTIPVPIFLILQIALVAFIAIKTL